LRAMLLDPGWREDDFRRVKDDCINAIKVALRGNNDEELAKEVLYATIFRGTPYGHYSGGTVTSLEALTLEDVQSFYHSHSSQSNLILGIAGGYSPVFLESIKKDFRNLPPRGGFRPREKALAPIEHNQAILIDKDSRSVAYSIGFPIGATRARPD